MASSWASHASRPYTLTTRGPSESVPSNSTTPSGCIDAGARSSTRTPRSARAIRIREAVGRPPGEPTARWMVAAANSPNAMAADAPDGSAAPSMIAPTNWNGISQRPRLRNGRPRCGEAVEITAVAMTRSPGGKSGGPSTSNSTSLKAVPSSMTIAATTATRTSDRTGARIRSRASAPRPRTTAATMSTSDQATGAQNANRHKVSKNAGTSPTTSETDCSSSVRSLDSDRRDDHDERADDRQDDVGRPARPWFVLRRREQLEPERSSAPAAGRSLPGSPSADARSAAGSGGGWAVRRRVPRRAKNAPWTGLAEGGGAASLPEFRSTGGRAAPGECDRRLGPGDPVRQRQGRRACGRCAR